MNRKTAYELLERAREQANKGMQSEAIKTIQEAKRLAPDNIDIIIEIAEIYYDINLIEKSLETIESAMNRDAGSPLLFLEIGKYQKHLGKHEDAISSFKSAICLDPGNAVLYVTLANMHTTTGNISEAIDNYVKALECNPQDKGSWMVLASLRQSQGDLEGCKDAYKALHGLDGTSVNFTQNLVRSLARLGKYGEAESTLRKAMEEDTQNIELYIEFVEILLISGKHKEALDANSLAISIAPKKDSLSIQRANIFERMGDYDEAFMVIKQFIENRSVKMEAALTFAKISPFLGMINEAKKLIAFIIERDKLDPPPDNANKALEWLSKSEKIQS